MLREIDEMREQLAGYIEATYHLSHPKTVAIRRALLKRAGGISQEPYVESTPTYVGDRPFKDLNIGQSAKDLLSRLASAEHGNLLFNPPYEHQARALELSQHPESGGTGIVVTTGTGSGKTEAFLLPVMARLAEEAADRPSHFSQRAVRALLLYPMNALVNDQLGRLRTLIGDESVRNWFKDAAGRPAKFGRYTGRTLYPGHRDAKRDQDRLKSLSYYLDLEDGAKAGDSMTAEPVLATSEIQGNSLGGFNKKHQALIHFTFPKELAAFRQWLLGMALTDLAEVVAFKRQLLAVQAADGDTAAMKACWQNIAFTYLGLLKLTPTAAQFTDKVFGNGLDGTASRTLGDPTTAGAPGEISTWVIGCPASLPDAILIVAADDPADLDATLAARRSDLVNAGCTILHVDLAHDPSFYSDATYQFDAGHEHFGFRDGISQPGVRGQLSSAGNDWLTLRPAARPGAATDPEYAQPGQVLVWPGEFVFGYLKQNLSFARLGTTGRKLGPPAPATDPSAVAPWWAANGSFLVFRRLHQDVPAFRAFCDSVAASASAAFLSPMSTARAAALIIGRWPSGAPVRLSPDADDLVLGGDDARNNDFDFLDDQEGRVCPLAAHTRKVNPRGVATDDGIAPHTLGHRLLRRGIPYGPPLPPGAPADGVDRGLLFLSYQTDIQNQFMFLGNRWANATNRPVASVAPVPPGVVVGDGFDMVIGSNPDGGHERFFVCYDGAIAARTETAAGQPNWVYATGGGFYFSPAISAVRALAAEA